MLRVESDTGAMNSMHNDKTAIPQLLASLPLFAQVGEEAIAHLAAATREKRLARGEVLFQRGDPARGFHVVLRGQIKLAFSSAQGNEKVVEIIGPQQSFGEAVMFMDRPYPVFAEALSDTLLLTIGKNAISELLERDPHFAKRLLAGLSARLHSLVRDVESYTLRSSTQRLIGYLLQDCQSPDAERPAGEQTIALPTSKQVIASRLNLTPETLSRIFAELTQAGLISVHGKQVTIHDCDRLSRYEP